MPHCLLLSIVMEAYHCFFSNDRCVSSLMLPLLNMLPIYLSGESSHLELVLFKV